MIRTEIQLYIVVHNTFELEKIMKKYVDLRKDYYFLKLRNNNSETLKMLEQEIMKTEKELFDAIIKARDESLIKGPIIRQIGATKYEENKIVNQIFFDEEEVIK